MKFFLDTYAMVEIVRGNEKYNKYVDQDSYTTIFNLFELYYTLLRDYGEEIAKEKYYEFYIFLINIRDEWIFLAAKFKLENKKFDISYTDALGYMIAKENEMKFLTGDKEFKNLNNVEFVK